MICFMISTDHTDMLTSVGLSDEIVNCPLSIISLTPFIIDFFDI